MTSEEATELDRAHNEEQIALASRLADDLENCGHDVSWLDLMDSLSSCGLILLAVPQD